MGLRFNIDLAVQSKSAGKAASDMGRVAGAADKAGKSVGGVNVGLKRMAQLAGVAFGAREIGQFLASTVRAASDVQEMQSLLEVTFGKAVDDVREWAAETSGAVGRSRFELLRFAGDFAAFLKPLGTAPDVIRPMSQELTQLTVDLASFRNLAEEDVFAKLMSGLAGETEAVRRLGIDLSAAAVEQELLNQGINKTQAEATQAEKVMARYAIILRQTSDAQGDAERTSGGFANIQRRLEGILMDVRVEIGKHLLPKISEMAKEMAEFAKTQDFEDAIKGIGDAAGAAADLVHSLVGAVRDLANFGEPLADVFNEISGRDIDPERLRTVASVVERIERFLTFDLGRAAGGSESAIAGRIRAYAEAVEEAAQKVHVAKDGFDLSGVLSESDAKIAELMAEGMKKIGQATEESAQVSKEAMREASAATKEYQDRLEDLKRTINPTGAALADIAKKVEFAWKAFRSGDLTIRELTTRLHQLGQEAAEVIPKIEVLSKHVENLPKGVAFRSEGVAEMGEELDAILQQQEEARQRQEEYNETVRETVHQWADVAGEVAHAFEGIDSGFAKAVASAARFIETLLRVIAQLKTAQTMSEQIALGIGAGTALGQQAGGLLGGKGHTAGKFGGEGEGDYTQEGAAFGAVIGAIIGAFFFGFGAAVGGILGGIAGGVLGSMIKHGADEAKATLRLEGQKIEADVYRDEGGLGKVLENIAGAVTRSIENILSIFDASIEAIPAVKIKVRGDKISVAVDGYRKQFEEMDEALAFLTANIIARSKITGNLDEAFTQVLDAGHFTDLEGLEAAVGTVDKLITIEKQYVQGLSEQEIVLQNLPGHIEQLSRRLEDLGLSADQVTRLSGAAAVQAFTDARRAITGEQQTTEQRKATQRAQAELFNAQLTLEIARLEAEREILMSKATLTDGEVKLGLAKLQAGKKFLDAEVGLFRGNLEVQEHFVKAGAAIMAVGASTITKQIQAITAVIEALKKIGLIDIGSLRLPNLPKIGGNLGDLGGKIGDFGDAARDAAAELERAVESLRATLETLRTFRMDLLGGETQPVRNQLLVAQREAARAFQRARANGGNQELVDEFIAAQRRLLDVGRGAFGSGAGFQHFLRQVLGRTENLEDLFGAKLDELLKPPAEQTAEHTKQLVEQQQKIEEHTRNVAADSRRNADTSGRIEGETRRSSSENQLGHGKTRHAISDLDTHLKERFESLERALERALTRVA